MEKEQFFLEFGWFCLWVGMGEWTSQ